MDAIGVFDSGVGGLTVLKALQNHWPHENFVYLADTARLPYGSKSLHTIHHYAEQNIRFLMKYGVKAVIVACNSASTAILEQPLSMELPVFNVVQPGARKAVEASASRRIGVLGTRATVLSEAYPHAIRRLVPDAEVFQQPCPLLVPLVEEGWLDDPITNLVVYRYLGGLMTQNIDTLILGCTHYPALRRCIEKVAGKTMQLVDSSMGLVEDLENSGLLKSDRSQKGHVKVLCTDFSPRLEETFRLLLDGVQYDSLETVNL
jgi:glutamate racemase